MSLPLKFLNSMLLFLLVFGFAYAQDSNSDVNLDKNILPGLNKDVKPVSLDLNALKKEAAKTVFDIPLQGRDFDNDGISDLQEVEDKTDWKNPLSNSLFLEVEGEFEVGKTVSFSLVHPKLGRIKNAFFVVKTKNNEFKLSTSTGIAKYDVIDSGVQRITAGTGLFKITQDLIPVCTLENQAGASSGSMQTILLLFSSFSIGLLAVKFDLRHFKTITFYLHSMLKVFTVVFAGSFFLLPFAVLLFFESFGLIHAKIFAFLTAYFELIAVLLLHAYYSFKPLPVTPAPKENPYRPFFPKIFFIEKIKKTRLFFQKLGSFFVLTKPVSQKDALNLKLEKLGLMEVKMLKIKDEIEKSDALPEEKQAALQKVWGPLNKIRQKIKSVELKLDKLKK